MKKLIILFILFISYNTSKNINTQPQFVKLRGVWCLNADKINYKYTKLIFLNDSLVTLDNLIDTIYSHRYYLNDNTLYLSLPDNKWSSNKIIKLTQDSLVLETLLEKKEKQTYYRCD